MISTYMISTNINYQQNRYLTSLFSPAKQRCSDQPGTIVLNKVALSTPFS